MQFVVDRLADLDVYPYFDIMNYQKNIEIVDTVKQRAEAFIVKEKFNVISRAVEGGYYEKETRKFNNGIFNDTSNRIGGIRIYFRVRKYCL